STRSPTSATPASTTTSGRWRNSRRSSASSSRARGTCPISRRCSRSDRSLLGQQRPPGLLLQVEDPPARGAAHHGVALAQEHRDRLEGQVDVAGAAGVLAAAAVDLLHLGHGLALVGVGDLVEELQLRGGDRRGREAALLLKLLEAGAHFAL